jgi:hypothetical protein
MQISRHRRDIAMYIIKDRQECTASFSLIEIIIASSASRASQVTSGPISQIAEIDETALINIAQSLLPALCPDRKKDRLIP